MTLKPKARTRTVWIYRGRYDTYPLGFFTSRKKAAAEIERITRNNRQARPCDYEIESREVR